MATDFKGFSTQKECNKNSSESYFRCTVTRKRSLYSLKLNHCLVFWRVLNRPRWHRRHRRQWMQNMPRLPKAVPRNNYTQCENARERGQNSPGIRWEDWKIERENPWGERKSERELLSAKKTVEQLKMELAQMRRVEKQPDGPVITSSLAKITEGEHPLPGNACGVLSPYMWGNPPFSKVKKLPSCKKYIRKYTLHFVQTFHSQPLISLFLSRPAKW